MATLVDTLSLIKLRADGFRSRWQPTSAGSLHLLEAEGSGALPPLVLVHGVGSRGTHYRSLVGLLRPHFRRMILPDLLGHGLSELPPGGLSVGLLGDTLREALDEVLDEPVVLFGNSLGGMMAIRYAAGRPERVLALAVNSPAGAAVTDDQLRVLVDRFDINSHQKSVELVRRGFATPLPAPAQHVVALLVKQQLAVPHINQLLKSVRRDDVLSPDELAGLAMPVLLSWGREERVLLDEQLEFFLAHLPPHARVERPEGFGHSPYLERPADLSALILAHAREALGGAARAGAAK